MEAEEGFELRGVSLLLLKRIGHIALSRDSTNAWSVGENK